MAATQTQSANPPSPRTGFEEPYWPIFVGFLVLSGMLAGSVLATCSFDTEDFWQSGWFWLATGALGVGFLAVLTLLTSRRIARRYQIAALFSLTLHVGALIGLAVTKLPAKEAEKEKDRTLPVTETAMSPRASAEAPRANILFNMNSAQKETSAVDLTTQAPVETTQPTAPSTDKVVARETPSAQPEGVKPDPSLLAMAAPDASVNAAKIARAANESTTIVRRGDSLAKLSRNVPTQPKAAPTSAEAPNLNPLKSTDAPAASAAARDVQRQVAATIAAQRPGDTNSTAAETPQIASLTRRAETPRADSTSAPLPTLPKKTNTPSQLPHTDTTAETAGKIAATPGATLQPGGIQVGRQSASPFVAKPTPDVPLATSEVGRAGLLPGPAVVARADSGSGGPLRAATTPTTVSRGTKAGAAGPATAANDTASALPSVNSGKGGTGGGTLQPNVGEIGRLSGAGVGSQGGAGTGAAAPGDGTLAAAVGPKTPARSSTSSRPNLSAGAGGSGGVKRGTTNSAATAGLLLDAANAGSLADNTKGNPGGGGPAGTPARAPLAISRGNGGAIGGGGGPGADAGANGGLPGAATTPSFAGKRVTGAPAGPQMGDAAGTLAMGDGIGIKRATSGKGAATGMTGEQLVSEAMPGGTSTNAGKPSGLDASGGGLGKLAKGGAPGGSSGRGGNSEIDTGQVQLAANVGSGGRPSGGGQPNAGGSSINLQPTLGGGGPGGGRVGRAGHAVGQVADLLADAGLPDGKNNAGIGGDGNVSGPGELKPGATELARGTGGVPGGRSGGGPGQNDGSELGGSDGAVAPSATRAIEGGGGTAGPTATNTTAANVTRNSGNGTTGGTGKGGSGAETLADDLQAPSLIAGNGGSADGGLVAAKGGTGIRQATGIHGENLSIPLGAAEGSGVVDSVATAEPGKGVGQRKNNDAVGDGPQVGSLAGSAPRRRGGGTESAAGVGQTIDAPELVGDPGGIPNGRGTGKAGSPDGLTTGVGAVGRRRTAGGITVPVSGIEGEGGLGDEPSVSVGLPQPAAKVDAVAMGTDPSRFNVTKKATGPLALDTRVRDAAQSFSGRLDPTAGGAKVGPTRNGAGGSGLPGEIETRTETAIESGLKFLVRHQSPDGHWSLHDYPGATKTDVGIVKSDAAGTGLALLSFLGAGYDHFDGEHKAAIKNGLKYLIDHQKPTGDFYTSLYVKKKATDEDPSTFYSHAIATMALCEALGMTGDEELRQPAQKALDYIVKMQNQDSGGWRYAPQSGSDMSVTGWVMTALKSGEFAGLKVPEESYARVKKWLNKAQAGGDASQYVYNPFAKENVETRDGRKATAPMSSVGLLMRLYTGSNRTNPHMIAGADRLKKSLPELTSPSQSTLGTYYWYYATQVMYHMGGEHWQTWNNKLHPLLVNTQVRSGPLAGSWDPHGGTADQWATYGGRLYVTTLNLLSLEVQYRHLPLYEATGK